MTENIVPEDFDLEAAKHSKSTTPAEARDRCPECQSLKIHSKVDHYDAREYDTEYYCSNCGEHFDDPLEAGHDA